MQKYKINVEKWKQLNKNIKCMLFMQPPEIKSGPTEIIASGTVISFKNNSIEIIFGSASERLKLIIEFEDDKENKEPLIKASISSNKALILKLINYNNPLGMGNSEPINIGNFEGRELHLNYRVHALTNDLNKTVHYTIYLGEEVSTNGNS